MPEGFLESTLRIHLGPNFFQFAGAGLQPFFQGAAISCMLLVNFVLDVPAETVPEDLARPRCLDHAAERENPHTQDRCLGRSTEPKTHPCVNQTRKDGAPEY